MTKCVRFRWDEMGILVAPLSEQAGHGSPDYRRWGNRVVAHYYMLQIWPGWGQGEIPLCSLPTRGLSGPVEDYVTPTEITREEAMQILCLMHPENATRDVQAMKAAGTWSTEVEDLFHLFIGHAAQM